MLHVLIAAHVCMHVGDAVFERCRSVFGGMDALFDVIDRTSYVAVVIACLAGTWLMHVVIVCGVVFAAVVDVVWICVVELFGDWGERNGRRTNKTVESNELA